MGVVIRQSIKTSLITLTGTALGLLNVIFIYTQDLETYGFLQILLSTAAFIAPIASLGSRGVINRYFPNFKNSDESRAAFFTFGLIVNLIGILLMGLIGYFIVIPWLPSLQSDQNNLSLFIEYGWIILLATTGHVLYEFIDSYIQNFRLVAVQIIFTNIVPKLFVGALVLGAVYLDLNYTTVGYSIVLMNFLIVIGLLIYLSSLGELRYSFNFGPYFTPELKQSILSYAAYAIIGIFGAKIALHIDNISLGAFVSEKAVGVYRIITIAATLIDIPLRSMSRITLPLVAEAMNDKDYVHISQLYRDSSRTLTFGGLMLFTGLFVSLTDIFIITGRASEFTGGLLTFALLGGSRIVNMITSINNQVLMYSHLYRYNLFFVLGLAVSNIYFNWLMIVEWQLGIVGAALATFLALSLYNILRSLFVYLKLKIHPLTSVLILPALLATLIISFFSWWPLHFHPIINILVRSAVVGPAFLALCWFTPFFPAIRKLLTQGLTKVRSLL